MHIFALEIETAMNARKDCERPLVERPTAAARGPPEPGPRRAATLPLPESDLTRLKAWKCLLTRCLLPSLPELALRSATPSPSCHAPLQPGSLTSDPLRTPASSLPQSILQPAPVPGRPAGLPRLSWPCLLQLVLCPPHPAAAGILASDCGATFRRPAVALAGASAQLPHLPCSP